MSSSPRYEPWHIVYVFLNFLDLEVEIEHPDSCIPYPENGRPKEDYVCPLEHDLHEWHEIEELTEGGRPGFYRMRVWNSGPDYWGEYDGGIEVEDASAPHLPGN